MAGPLSPAIAPPVSVVGPLRGYVDYYRTAMRIAISTQLQYRISNAFFMVGLIAEPIIYLVVWSTIARQQGGEVDGISAGQFAAYYIVWTLVRNMNVWSVGAWEDQIRNGGLSGALLRPIHPMHWELGYFAGWKLVVIVLWLPIAVVLSLLFRPELDPRPIDIAVFGVAIWGAYLVRAMTYGLLGLVSFWTTRVSPIVQVVMTLELLFSGRLVPLTLMPDWAQAVANTLPFKWTFGFPIEALVGRLPIGDLLGGLVMQAAWVAVGVLAIRLAWPFAVRRYGAVGG